ncbi:MAG: ABC transporter ATP-binding protein [Longimicrobiales bacterium]
MTEPRRLGFISYCLRAHPARTSLMVALLVLAGLAEGIGLATLLPVLELAADEPARSSFSASIEDTLRGLGLDSSLSVLLAIIVLGMSLKALFQWLAMRQVGYTVAAVATDLRLSLIRALLDARWSFFAAQPSGHFANAVSIEAYRASAAYREACSAMAGLIHAFVYLTIAFLISPPVAFLAIAAGGVFLLALSGFVRMSHRAGNRQTDHMMSLIAHLVDALQALKPVKAMGREDQLLRFLEHEAHAFNEAQRGQVLAVETLKLFQQPLLVLMVAAGLFLLLGRGTMPFAAALVMIFLFYRLMGLVHMLQSHYQSMAAGEGAFWAMRSMIERTRAQREVSTGRTPPPPLTHAVTLDHVSFRHGSRTALHDVSLAIPAGSLVAIVGPSGAGKTTLADLIAGLYRPDSGAVRIDSVAMTHIDIVAWRRMVGYVPQEPLLLHDSIRRNVTMGDDLISSGDVETALREAGAWPFVEERAGGMDAPVGERGGMLSGGQRQRIALARALVRKPALLVLDEVTAGLDSVTEAAIFETLHQLRGRVTVLFVSHRSAVVDVADLVVRLEDGRTLPTPAGSTLA